MLRDLPPRARWYIRIVIAAGVLALALLLPRANLLPLFPFILLVLLSSLTSAFKVQLPITSGVTMSVSYVVDIASLILRGPHATMIVGAISGWSQTVFRAQTKNPAYRVLFNMSSLVLTVEAAGQVFQRLQIAAPAPGSPALSLTIALVPLVGMALTYYVANTGLIAAAVGLSTSQPVWRIWKNDFASSVPSYLLGALSAAVAIAVVQSSGYGLTFLLAAAPLYLTYKVYRAGIDIEARQGAILESAHDAILTVDERLRIREFNPAAERMFGARRLDVLGRGVDTLIPAAERRARMEAFTQYLAAGTGPLAHRQLELTGLRADGSEFPIEVTLARLGSDARPELTVFIRDITERRALEEQLRQSQKLEAIGRLAGGVAHDFNNILMSIMGAADLLLMQLGADDPARAEAGEVKQAVERGAGLTRQLLSFGRRQPTRPRRFALGDVVAGMETMLRRLIGPEVDFRIVQGPAPVMVMADPGQIEQLLLNLVVNARDAMPSGGRLTVRVDEIVLDEDAATAIVEGRAGRYARLSVADTGTGIDDQVRARLFEPFFTTKGQGKGTGLGLSIVYGIVKQSGGYIKVLSERGRGATFTVYLPAAR